jgi:hypothetical protein
MAIFDHGITPNSQNKVSSCQLVYILQPWTPDSPLDRFIHTDFGNIVHEERHRRDFDIAVDVAIDGDGTPDPQNKVTSCQLVYILQPWTPDSPLDRFIQTDFGNIVLEGRYRRDFAILDDVFVVPLGTRSLHVF